MRLRTKSGLKRHKALLSFIALGCLLVLTASVLFFTSGIARVSVGVNSDTPFMASGRTHIIASEVSESASPNTYQALSKSIDGISYKVDALELPLRITKDGILVIVGDSFKSLSNVSKVLGKNKINIYDYSYAQLSMVNTSENYRASGEYPYKGLRGPDISPEIRLLTLREAIHMLGPWKTNYMFSIWDTGEYGKKAMDALYAIIKEFGLSEDAVVGVESKEIGEYADRYYPQLYRTSSIEEAAEFYLCELFNVDLTAKKIKYDILLFSRTDCVVNLKKKAIVDYAHFYGLAVYYRANKKRDIEQLVNVGADAVVTDAPEVVFKIIY